MSDVLEDAVARYVARNPASRRRAEQAAEVLPGGNTRSVLHFEPFPLAFARGEGAHLWSLDGDRYVDLLGEFTAGLYGHSHPVILDAMRGALERGISYGGTNDLEHELAALLCARFEALELVRFTNSGTEANLMALAVASTTPAGARSWSSRAATTVACWPSAAASRARSPCRTRSCSATTTTPRRRAR